VLNAKPNAQPDAMIGDKSPYHSLTSGRERGRVFSKPQRLTGGRGGLLTSTILDFGFGSMI